MALAFGMGGGVMDMGKPFGGTMQNLMLAMLYTALMMGANPVAAQPVLEGDMKKLILVDAKPVPDFILLDANDGPHPLSGWQGQWVVLNFWATWCAPCREEMPSLANLQHALPELAVLPVATGRNAVAAITRFYVEAGVTSLPVLRDPKSTFAREMGVLGLPVTVIIDPQGREVGRLIGDAAWDSPEALAMFRGLMQP